ncbi:MAG TPA: hypothetical protein VN673_07830 [Clostridia bacterium]|nr:hypothetical protein [Clostridia bacterium]
MRVFALILVVICCSSCQHGRQVAAASHVVLSPNPAMDTNRPLYDSQFEGATYVFAVPDVLLRSTSRWRADSERLPLSPGKAEAAAISEARRLHPDVQAWSCISLSLERADKDVWFYLVKLFRSDLPSAGLPDFLTIPVLLSGAPVEPVNKRGVQQK